MLTESGDFRLGGDLIMTGAGKIIRPGITRANLIEDSNAVYPIPLTDWRIWDSGQPLTATPGTDDLGHIAGTWGTANSHLSAGDLKAAGATSRYARAVVTLPPEYIAGQTVTLRFAAGMLTTISDTTCTIDAAAFVVGRDTLISGSDLVATSATSINSVTFANYDFTITAGALLPGDRLDIRIVIACNDGATATAVTPAIAAIDLLLDIKG